MVTTTMNNPEMREIFGCSEEELAQLKNAFRYQMENNFVRGKPFLGQRVNEVDANGEIRERMWRQVAISEPSFADMLTGRRCRRQGHMTHDFEDRLRRAKGKVCRDFTCEKRKRRPEREFKEEESEGDDSDDSDLIVMETSDRRLRKRCAVSYDLQKIRVVGGDGNPEASAVLAPPKDMQMRTRQAAFGNMRKAVTPISEDPSRIPSPSRSGPPLLVSDLSADPRVLSKAPLRAEPRRKLVARPCRLGFQPAPQVDEEEFSLGEELAPNNDSGDGSEIVVASPGHEEEHHDQGSPNDRSWGSHLHTRQQLSLIRGNENLRNISVNEHPEASIFSRSRMPTGIRRDEGVLNQASPHDQPASSIFSHMYTPSASRASASSAGPISDAAPIAQPERPTEGSGLAGMVKKMIRFEVAEAEARIMERVERRLAASERREDGALKAEIRREIMVEIGKGFE